MDDKKKQDQDVEKKAAEKRKGIVLARRSRRLKTRQAAKALGHKLGSKNRSCKRCGVCRTDTQGVPTNLLAEQCQGKKAA